MNRSTVLSQYPLSRRYSEAIKMLLGPDTRFVTLGELKHPSPLEILLRVRRLGAGVLAIGLEDPTSAGALPILKLVAAVSRCRDLSILGPDLRRDEFSRLDQAGEWARLILACCGGGWTLACSAVGLRRLRLAERIPPKRPLGATRVAYINTNLWFGVKAGGSVGHISGVANAFLEHGLDVDYLSVGGRLMLRKQVRHIELQAPKIFALPFVLNHYGFDRSFEEQAARHLEPDKIAFLYQRLSLGNFSGVRLSRRTGLPLVVEYNGSEVWVAQRWGPGLRFSGIAKAAELETLKHAHVVVTISNVLRDELIQKGISPERIVTYPNCIDPTTFDPDCFSRSDVEKLRNAHGIPRDACVVTFVGTFGAWHGAEVLARAVRELCDHRLLEVEKTKLYFWFVGDGIRMPEVRSILDAPSCQARVSFAGLVPQADAPAYLAASDILVSPHVENADGSQFFGSPTKLFEYMAMAKAVIASDLSQIGEVLKSSIRWPDLSTHSEDPAVDRLALLVPPGNPCALADSLVYLAARPELRRRLGDNSRREALQKYTWRRHVGSILERVEAFCGTVQT